MVVELRTIRVPEPQTKVGDLGFLFRCSRTALSAITVTYNLWAGYTAAAHRSGFAPRFLLGYDTRWTETYSLTSYVSGIAWTAAT
jgi:propanediol dehydratase large subunit